MRRRDTRTGVCSRLWIHDCGVVGRSLEFLSFDGWSSYMLCNQRTNGAAGVHFGHLQQQDRHCLVFCPFVCVMDTLAVSWCVAAASTSLPVSVRAATGAAELQPHK